MNWSRDWQVESLRVSVFPMENDSTSPSQLWDHYIVEPPVNIQIEHGRINQRFGQYKHGNIYLVKLPNQIDWRYVLEPDDTLDELTLPVWGSLDPSVDTILQFADDWLTCPDIMPVSRLAFGAVLLIPTLDLSQTYKILQNLLPSMELGNVADFGYHINRRRRSIAAEDLQINRLSRWNIATFERNDSTLDPVQDIEENRNRRLFAPRLELDINTVPLEAVALPSESLLEVFKELVHVGLEIARKGDIQ